MRSKIWGLCVTAACFAVVVISAQGADNVRSAGLILNAGQWPSHIIAATRTRGADVWVTTSGVICDEYTVRDGVRTGTVFSEHFAGAVMLDPDSPVGGTTVSYFSGGSRNSFSTAAFRDQPIRFRFPSGAIVNLSVGEDGRLVRSIQTGQEHLAESVHIVRSDRSGVNTMDATKAGSFVYGSYIGGGAFDAITAIEVMPSGNLLVSGTTAQMTVPTGVGGYSKSIKGDNDAFVLICDAKFQRILAMTFIGGSAGDRLRSMTIDGQQNVYLAIETTSNDMPTTPAAQFKTIKAATDAYVAKLDSTLTKLLTGFYHGGNRDDIPRDIAVDESGFIYLAGSTTSTANFPNNMTATANLVWQYQDGRDTKTRTVGISSGNSNLGQQDGFIAIYSATGTMQKSRYYGREGNDAFTSVAVDSRGFVVLTGTTTSTSFEAVPIADATWTGRLPYDRTYNGGTSDVFVVKMSSGLTFSQTDGITFATLFGGSADEETVAMWLDSDGKIFIGGNTRSNNLPTSASVFSQAPGRLDGFVAQVADNGTQVISCTYIGGSGDDLVRNVRPSGRTSAFLISGTTTSSDFPTEGFGATAERFGLTDGFYTMMNFGAVTVSTLLTGLESDTVVDAILDFRGDALLAANSTSANLRTHDSAYASYSGASDGYLTKYTPGSLEIVTPKGGEVYCIGSSKPLAWDASGVADTTKFRIEYSVEGSGKWADVIRSTGGRSYLWKIPPSVVAGSYVLRISTVNGHVSILTTPFMIDAPPSITRQPASTSVCQGAKLTLSVASSSVAAKYQWRKDGVNITGANTATFTADTASTGAAGKYDCVISGECPPAVTSQPATVTIQPRPTITTQPTPQTVDEGKPVTLTVVATGPALTYQWKRDGMTIVGASSASYTVPAASKADEGSYACEVSGQCGSITSQSVVVKVNAGTSVDDSEISGIGLRLLGPQPASDVVMIAADLPTSLDLNVRFLDARGSILSTKSLGMAPPGQQTFTLDVSTLPRGLVMIEVSSGFTRSVLPVIIRD
ncbi:MAG: hypothetical protein FGM33_00995 [Candidatus Kapabacteria bacterium]|nr:hypothetical protein [Candidatus Kapabacteria bacterium]